MENERRHHRESQMYLNLTGLGISQVTLSICTRNQDVVDTGALVLSDPYNRGGKVSPVSYQPDRRSLKTLNPENKQSSKTAPGKHKSLSISGTAWDSGEMDHIAAFLPSK